MTNEEIMSAVSKGKAYTLMFLYKGKNRAQDKTEEDRLQMEHLAYLFKLREEGKLLLNGPLTGEGDLRGIAIFSLTDTEEVRRLSEEDPAVKAGRLRVEVFPWFGLPGDHLR
ncbi:MAG TPA: YciI family protein [Bacteroidia bacterium]|nr:YciI family protein [Bacteroidia bacterium]